MQWLPPVRVQNTYFKEVTDTGRITKTMIMMMTMVMNIMIMVMIMMIVHDDGHGHDGADGLLDHPVYSLEMSVFLF